MTPRKELFIKIQRALTEIKELEYVDLDRRQFSKGKTPEIWTAALVKINTIRWETMVERKQEGNGTLEITLFCKDGWLDQHHLSDDPENGLIEIDLIDKIVDKLQLLQGDYFKPLQQFEDEPADDDNDETMSYKIKFNFTLYRQMKTKYTNLSLLQPS